MARTRDIVIVVVIASSFVLAIGFFGLMFVGMMSESGEFTLSGMGGDVGIIELFGVINEETGRPIIKQFDKWADNSSIKAIVLHINSPGGGVAISQEIYDAVLRAREEKPVVAAMASVAASGGYYAACGADRIIANPGTITGSIGVIFQFQTYTDLMSKVGIETETIKSGELKDVGGFHRPMSKKEELMLQAVVMDTYEQFVEVVAAGRGMDKEEVYPVADGSIFTGMQAYNLGLVDELGGLEEAINLAAELAGIEGDPSVVRQMKRRKYGIFDLMEGLLQGFPAIVRPDAMGPRLLYMYE